MFSWLPKNVSTFGGDVDSILYLIYYIVMVWFISDLCDHYLLSHSLSTQTRAKSSVHHAVNSLRQYGWILGLGLIVLSARYRH